MSARYLSSPVADSTPEHGDTRKNVAGGKSGRALNSAPVYRAQKQVNPSRKPLYSIRALLAFVLLAVFGTTSAAPAFAAFAEAEGSGSTIATADEATNSANAPDASMLCWGIGYGMNSVGGSNTTGGAGFGSEPILPNATNRKWTIDEAYGSGLGFTQWNGTGSGLFLSGIDIGGGSGGEDEGSGEASPLGDSLLNRGNAADQQHLLAPTSASCMMGFITSGIPGMVLAFSSFIVDFAILIAGFAFDPNFICRNPSNPEGTCINMLGILAGDGGSGDGIIGALTNSIYFPLLAIAFLMVAMSLVWTGIIQRQYMKSFQNILWSLGAMVLGVVFLLNPMVIAGLPQQITSVATGCIVGALNGDNCFTGNNTTSSGSVSDDISSDAGRECTSQAGNTNMNQRIQMSINSMGCSIYKAFVLNAWSQAQFGRGYDAMSVTDPRTADAISEAGLQNSDFRVGLFSTRSHNQHLSQNYRISDHSFSYRMGDSSTANNSVTNVAAYQLALGSSTHNPLGQGSNLNSIGALVQQDDKDYDTRWFNVATVAANDPEMWDSWNSGGVHRGGAAVLGLITAALGTFVIFVTSMFALVYLVTSILLTAFAPLFFLFAVEPNRGKRMFFGWLESLGSNILKYIASAFFLIVTLALFSAVLSSAESVTTALIFVLIMTAALLMYRKTLVELIGRVNMGGEKMQSQAMERMKQRFNIEDPNSAIRKANAAVVGGAVGGGFAGTAAGYKDRRDAGAGRISSIVKAQGSGLKHSVIGSGAALNRQMQSGSGALGDAFREKDRRRDGIDTSKAESIDKKQNSAKQRNTEAQRVAANSAQDARAASDELMEDKDYMNAHNALNGLDENGEQAYNTDYDGNTTEQKDALAHGEEAKHVATEREVQNEELEKFQKSAADPDAKKAVTQEVDLSLQLEDKQMEAAGLSQKLTEAQRAGDGDAANRIENELKINAAQTSEIKHELGDLRGGAHAGAIAAFHSGVDNKLKAKGLDKDDDYQYVEGGHFGENFAADKARVQSAAEKLNGNEELEEQAKKIDAHIKDRVDATTAGAYKDHLAKAIADYRDKHGEDPGAKTLANMETDATGFSKLEGAEKRMELEQHYGDKTTQGLERIQDAAKTAGAAGAVGAYNVNAAERLGQNDLSSKKSWKGEDDATYKMSPPRADGTQQVLRKGQYDEGFRHTGVLGDDVDFGEEGSEYGSKEEFFGAMAERDEVSRQERAVNNPGGTDEDPTSGGGGGIPVPPVEPWTGGGGTSTPSTSGTAVPETPRSTGIPKGDPKVGGSSASTSSSDQMAKEMGIDPETGDPIDFAAPTSGSGRSRNADRLSNALDEQDFDDAMGSATSSSVPRSGGIPKGDPKVGGSSASTPSSAQIADDLGIDPATGDPVEPSPRTSGSSTSSSASTAPSSSSERSRNADRLKNALDEHDFDQAMGSAGLPGAGTGTNVGTGSSAGSASTPDRPRTSGGLGDAIRGTQSNEQSSTSAEKPARSNTSGIGNAFKNGNDENKGDDTPSSGGTPAPKAPKGPKDSSGGGAATAAAAAESVAKETRRGGLGGAMDSSNEGTSGGGIGRAASAAPRTGTRNTSAGAPPESSARKQGEDTPQSVRQAINSATQQGSGNGPSSRASSVAKKINSGSLSPEEADSFLEETKGIDSKSNISRLREEVAKNYGSEAVQRSRFIDRNTEDIADGAVIRDVPKVTPVRTTRRNPGNRPGEGRRRGDG